MPAAPRRSRPLDVRAAILGGRLPGSGRWFYGWTIVGVAFLATFAHVGYLNSVLGIFQPALHEEFGWSRAEVAGALTLGSLAGGLLSPLFGVVLDRYGARWLIAGPAILLAVGCLLLAELRELWQFYLLFATGRALAISAMMAAAVVAVSNWFIRRRPLAIAIGTLGMRVGNATIPLIVAIVIAARGWPDGFRALGVVFLLFGIVPALLLMRRRPEDMGLHPDGDPPPTPEQRRSAALLDPAWTLRAALRTRAYWLVGLAFALAIFGNGAINFHQIPHLVDRGLTTTSAALILTVMSITGAAGGLVSGIVATRVRARWTMVGALILQSSGVLLLLAVDSFAMALLYAVWYGWFFGVMVTQLQVVYAEYFGRLQLGVIRGSFQPVALGFNAAGPLALGVWFDRAGGYEGPFTLIIVFFLIAALALSAARYPTPPEPAGMQRAGSP
ncbi:MAG: MFS transporter [Chloroflexi bacterium]|nr:MFS transporter [Chloroflexota bacterium]